MYTTTLLYGEIRLLLEVFGLQVVLNELSAQVEDAHPKTASLINQARVKSINEGPPTRRSTMDDELFKQYVDEEDRGVRGAGIMIICMAVVALVAYWVLR